MTESDTHTVRPWLVVGNPGCRRVAQFNAALEQLRHPPATLLRYSDFLNGTIRLRDHLVPGSRVRFESAAENWEVRKALLNRGIGPALSQGYPAAGYSDISRVPNQSGILLWPRQLYLGFADLLHDFIRDMRGIVVSVMNALQDILLLFDKPACQLKLQRCGIPIPEIIGVPTNYEQVRELCRKRERVMLKLAHGSGGAGCVALHRVGGKLRALTSAHWTYANGKKWMYSSQRVRQILDESELAELIDQLCREGAHLEKWLPKARIDGYGFDLRIVTIGGIPTHAVPRLSHAPFTNLNLGNRRGDLELAKARIGDLKWRAIMSTCKNAAMQFPQSTYLGIDVLVTPQGDHFVLEVNAFGDLLPGILSDGLDTYASEIARFQRAADGLPALGNFQSEVVA